MACFAKHFGAGYIDPEKYTFSLCFDAEYYDPTQSAETWATSVMLVFGVAGFMRAYQYNVVPIVLGLILGPIAEEGLSGIDPKSEFIITGFRFLVYETDLCRIDDIWLFPLYIHFIQNGKAEKKKETK